MPRYLLALETSGRTGSLALLADGALLEERALDERGRRHAQTLVAELQELLRRHNIVPGELEAVAVSRGPGSFTGLRVGVVCAKTLAWAAGLKLLAIDTFAAIAEAAPIDEERVYVVDDAQRGDLFIGAFCRNPDGQIEPVQKIAIRPAEFWSSNIECDAWVLGPAVEALREEGLNVRTTADPQQNRPHARVIGSLGWRRLLAGECDDLWTLAPFYLRASAAEEKWDQTHGMTGPSA